MEEFDDDILYLVAIPALVFLIAMTGLFIERFLRKRRRARRRAYHSTRRSSRSSRSGHSKPPSTLPAKIGR